MSLDPIIQNTGDIKSLFSGIEDFNLRSDPFKNQRSMTYRDVGKMKDLFLMGPCKNSKVLTIEQDWGVVNNRLNSVRNKLKEKGLYGILSYMQGEGGSVWVLTPDSKWTSSEGIKSLNELINNDVVGKRWASAFNSARKGLGDYQDAPFGVTFVASMCNRTIPFFGRVAFGTAMSEGIISLVQIPTMGKNKEYYFSWLYVPKDRDLQPSDWTNMVGKGGNENEYNKFIKIREYLENECEPLNTTGDYSFDTSKKDKKQQEKPKEKLNKNPQENKEENPDNNKPSSTNMPTGNPLIDQAHGNSVSQEDKKESVLFEKVIKESYNNAHSFLSEVYLYEGKYSSYKYNNEDDEEEEYDYKGKPFTNKLKMEGGIPRFGPLY